MRQADKKYFGDVQQGRLNADDSPFVVGTNEWVNAENIRTGSTDKGFTGVVESVGGNVELPEPPSAKIFYFNVDFSPVGGYFQLGTTPSTSPAGSTGITSTNSLNYLTDIGSPDITSIDAGSWLISCPLLNSASTTTPTVKAEIQIYPLSGIPVTIATTNTVSIVNNVNFVTYNLQASIPQQTLLPTDRIAIKFIGTNISTGASVSFDTQNISSPNYYAILTTNIGTLNPTYDYITIGSVEDTENKRILYFNYDASPNRLDRIVCYYTEANKQYNVLLTSQVQGGLNFSKDSLIHSARISNLQILSWVDGTNNEPRKINIESGIKANDLSFNTDEQTYSFPLVFSEVTLIKRPPVFSPTIEKKYDNLFLNNLIQYNSFEFAFQYQYYDGEVSVVSAYSRSSRLNNASYTPPDNPPNYVYVTMSASERIPSTVKIVNLIARIGDGSNIGSTNANIIKTWNKEIDTDAQQIENHNNGIRGEVLNYSFYNNITGQTIASDDVLRAFDSVPIFSQTHEVSKSRYFLGNNIEGYNTPKETSLQIAFSNIVNVNTINQVVSLYYVFIQTSNVAPPQGQWTYRGWAVYTTINNQQGWYTITGGYEQFSPSATTLPVIPPPATLDVTNFHFITALSGVTNYVNGIREWVNNPDSGFVSYLWQYPDLAMNPSLGNPQFNYYSRIINNLYPIQITITGLLNVYSNIFPQLSSYRFGVVFYDYAMRKCGVVPRTITGLQLYYTFNYSIGGISPFTIVVYNEDITLYLEANDEIVISNGTGIDGTYTVLSFGYDSVLLRTNIVVSQAVSTTISALGTIDIYRKSTQDLTTPQRTYDYNQALGAMKWELDNTNSLTEIPDWAYYYSIVRTLNLRTRFFLQGVNTSVQLKYATKDSSGNYTFVTTYSQYTTTGIAIETSSIYKPGLGYTFTEGSEDICILTKNDTNSTQYQLPIIAQSGNYIILQPKDLGAFGATNPVVKYIFEIYTPYKASEQEPYYEMGDICTISSPKTSNRQYSTLSGYFNADTYMFSRSWLTETYFANAMSPNDTFWKRWESDAGKVNIITRLGQTDKNTNIAWSDTYISGTQINGSSTFRLGAETFVSDDCGSITKLQLTSKVQDQGQGSVMLALCNSEINSMYLGETQITDSTGKTQFFSANSSVVSTINILKGNYGCISPESVVQYRGKVYFVDLSNGRVVQYSDNGLDAISNVKMSKFWKNWAYKYQSLTKAEIEAFGDRPYIFSMVDSGHDELLISFPKLSNDPPKGYLPDYPNTVYPFDILDYKGKTMVYCLGTAAQIYPHWQGAYTFTTENFVSLQNRLFSFKGGRIFEQNQADVPNRFYGNQYPSSIMFTSNILSQVPKVYDNFVVESNLMPSFVYFYNNYPYIQTSDLDDTSFVDLEGIWYANILRNKIVPTATGFTTDGLLTAEVMRNTNMYVQATFSPTTEPLELRLIQLGTSISKGHIIT